jgi:hypothetical protein
MKPKTKALAGIASVMFGSGFGAFYINSMWGRMGFGLFAVIGGIIILEQVSDRQARAEVASE